MKRLFAIILIILVSAVLFSCGEEAPDGTLHETGGTPDESGIDVAAVLPETEVGAGRETDAETDPETVPETEAEKEPETEPETVPETEPAAEVPYVRVEGLTLDKYEVNIYVGSSDMPWVTMTPYNATNKAEIWSSDNTGVATVDAYGNIYGVSEGSCTVTVASADDPEARADVAVHVSPRPAEPGPANVGLTYIQGILVVNKTYALPSDYDPGVDPTAYAALQEMFAGAREEGISLWVASGYRSYATQKWLYNNYVSMDGKAAADTYSARPGHSEHQTGLAFDLNYVADWFANTKEGVWLAENSWKYGFIIRYQKGKEGITGYKYEPWHVRYIGKEAAQAVFESGLCLEEYLGIDSVYSY